MIREEAKEFLAKKALIMIEQTGETILDGDRTLEILDKVFDDFESRSCSNCIHGKSADGDLYFCTPIYEVTGGTELFTPPDYSCNKWAEKELQD